MSGAPALKDVSACAARAADFKNSAEKFDALHDEWFAVAYFYSAYHLVKGALIADPVFDSASKVAAVSPRLVMEDRFAIRHKGYIGGGDRALGVNDIVALLYPGVAAQYRRLHMASVHVRYLTGLGAITGASVRSDYEVVAAAYHGGALVHG